jgi:hypothetical protein
LGHLQHHQGRHDEAARSLAAALHTGRNHPEGRRLSAVAKLSQNVVDDLVFSPDGKHLATVSKDGSVFPVDLAPIVMALFWRGATRAGALAAMIGGFSSLMLLYVLGGSGWGRPVWRIRLLSASSRSTYWAWTPCSTACSLPLRWGSA